MFKHKKKKKDMKDIRDELRLYRVQKKQKQKTTIKTEVKKSHVKQKNGLRMPLHPHEIESMRTYAKSIRNEGGNFYLKIAQQSNRAKSTVIKYCHDIKNNSVNDTQRSNVRPDYSS